MSDGNGFQQLAHEMTETKERAAAWIIRGFIVIGGFLVTGLLGMGLYIFNDFKTTVQDNTEHLWKSVQQNQVDLRGTIGQLNTLSDQVKASVDRETDALSRLQNEQNDHEDRIRILERPHG